MTPAATAYIQSIYESIAKSRKIRGKPVPAYADWLGEITDLAIEARCIALGVR